ncbi:hypothetical protein ABT299_11955 [Spirillospora sp. NPDC000708]|uniref:Uncharacterized protein n=1 Tax=Actinomadura violacea TaxID=2819934 RepID=A0ABS3RY11_9ACTN|nr:hypothetical protein [Actinomadura violacea]MBO2461183.1 hypothetical protein [Actinomadura violacea]
MPDWEFDEAAIAGLIFAEGVQAAVDSVAEAAEAAAVKACPVNWGRLVATISIERDGAGRWVQYGNDTDARYAPYIEWGTRPHIITPSTKAALYWLGADHPVARVHHPGTPAFRVITGAAFQAAIGA